MRLPVALTVAGSDSGGGAGIQADLKTFAALGVHGTSAITAVTAQDTLTVEAILEMPPSLIEAQIRMVVEDLAPAAAKTGMLSSEAVIVAVVGALRQGGPSLLVVDPVMVAKGGARLLREEAVGALRSLLIPLATVLTPNIPEAEVLLGRTIETLDERRRAAEDLRALGPATVVLKGGHARDDAIDIVFDGDRMIELGAARHGTTNTHGSGCAFSAAITAWLARGLTPIDSVSRAKRFIDGAIAASLEVGRGHGPVNPMWDVPRPD